MGYVRHSLEVQSKPIWNWTKAAVTIRFDIQITTLLGSTLHNKMTWCLLKIWPWCWPVPYSTPVWKTIKPGSLTSWIFTFLKLNSWYSLPISLCKGPRFWISYSPEAAVPFLPIPPTLKSVILLLMPPLHPVTKRCGLLFWSIFTQWISSLPFLSLEPKFIRFTWQTSSRFKTSFLPFPSHQSSQIYLSKTFFSSHDSST